MNLSTLLDDKKLNFDVDICGITADSRKVKPGFMFVALPGLKFNGADFIKQAVDAGAVAVLCIPEAQLDNDKAIWITDDCPGRVFPHIVARFFEHQPDKIAAVTGTNGKTSVASFTQQIWRHLGLKAGSVGTLGIHAEGYHQETGLTTPDPIVLHKAMSDLCNLGVDHVVFEASSHGLAQYRLDGINISAAAFTNLTHDHLDYHHTEKEYFNAKARLFDEVLKEGKTAVLNIDCPYVSEVYQICEAKGHNIITVGKNDGDIRLLSQRSSNAGQEITISYQTKLYDIFLPLVGGFQAVNALMAVGLVIGCGGNVQKAFNALSYLRPVKGRMEQAGRLSNGARVYVDYAHTPDALYTVLNALKPHTKEKLSVVFGCGGDRDKTKRKIMGEIAGRYANRVYVTDDNPRSESAAKIRAEVLEGCPDAIDAGERSGAIRLAIMQLEKDDILLVAGKGHEQGQTICDKVIDFDDVSEVRSAITLTETMGDQNNRKVN
jgi:UDP-N-acetylmuramoyl-L-alanyl-D-glutamate--2,6-diaminopimelate ligase